MKTIRLASFVLSAVASAACSAPTVSSDTCVIEHVHVIPMDRERVLNDVDVVIVGETIVSLGRGLPTPPDARRIDGRGKWLIPGLVDMHGHLLADENIADEYQADELAVILANGVTTLRDPIGKPSLLALRAAVARGAVLGPKLRLGSPQLAGRTWPGVFNGREVHHADEARAAVREYRDAGYDFIKLTTDLSREAFDAATDEARSLGIRVIGHVGDQVRLQRALEARMQIEHMDQFLEALVPDDAPFRESVSDISVWKLERWKSLDWLDASRIPAIAKQVADAGVAVTPTNSFFFTCFARGSTDAEIAARPEKRFVSPELEAVLLRGRPMYWKNPPSEARRQRYIELRQRFVRELHAAGVKLLCGSDAPEWILFAGFATHRELDEFVAAGLTPYQALETATVNPHAWLGDLAQVGTIAPGKRADLVLLDANPLASIADVRKIAAVVVGGRVLERAELDRMLDAAATRLSKAKPLE
ncbi:MAG: amidohydrolase family protein [Planctomycetes bacterium]|nr:amidohydrolase family protein [Planctomycetota bacterium]